MVHIQFALAIILILLLVIYLSTLFVLRFMLKIKRDYNLYNKAKKSLPKAYVYSYIFFLFGSLLVYIIYKTSILFFLLLIAIDQIITSTKTLNLIRDVRQKYYEYVTIIFNLLIITLLIVSILLMFII